MADADSVPSLETDPGLGLAIQNTGCGDNDAIVVRALAGSIPTSPTVIGDPVYIGNCSDLLLLLDYDRGTAATDFEMYWEFSDNAKSDWFRDIVWDVSAGTGLIEPVYSYISMVASKDFGTTIFNPGASWIRFLIDGNATPGNSEFALSVLRGWHNTGVVIL